MAASSRRTRRGVELEKSAMIGVIADRSEQDIVREFFELFKTPWEFYREDRGYDVVLCAGECEVRVAGRVVLCYSGEQTRFDSEHKNPFVRQRKDPCTLSYLGDRIPIYSQSVTFVGGNPGFLTEQESGEAAVYLDQSPHRVLVRIGYDLFAEVRTLLTVGQPGANGSIPALELHIAVLRDLITTCGISLVEIPPVPEGFSFIACLTHDVDHPSVRQHKRDHTIVGFLWRAIFGSLRNVLRGRMSLRDLATNWAAALNLPFVHLGVAKDFWRNFNDRYVEIENGLPSTLFVIPFKGCAGRTRTGAAPAFRAAGYGARDLADAIKKVTGTGHEVGLHGIDAWLDHSKGSEEIAEIRRVTGASEIGVRMHWLYYDR